MLLEGFRDHLVARVGPELSREAEALFRELTNHEYDDLKVDEETLTIQIADGDSYFAIDRFSGSETDLANLALARGDLDPAVAVVRCRRRDDGPRRGARPRWTRSART